MKTLPEFVPVALVAVPAAIWCLTTLVRELKDGLQGPDAGDWNAASEDIRALDFTFLLVFLIVGALTVNQHMPLAGIAWVLSGICLGFTQTYHPLLVSRVPAFVQLVLSLVGYWAAVQLFQGAYSTLTGIGGLAVATSTGYLTGTLLRKIVAPLTLMLARWCAYRQEESY